MLLRMTTLVVAVAWLGSVAGAAEGLIELTVAGQPVQGRQLAHDRTFCRLIDREGAYHEVLLEDVSGFRQVSPTYKPASVKEVRERLSQGLDTRMEVSSRGNYVVCAPKGTARAYAELLERASQQFLAYLRVRKFDLRPAEFPLIAYVYPTRKEFLERSALDGIPVADSLRGYYHPRSNWIRLFHEPDEKGQAIAAGELKAGKGSSNTSRLSPQRHAADRQIALDGLSRQTAVHESIHQLAFNTGLHARLGENPLWVVEGLAMQFESAFNDDDSARSPRLGVNLNRLQNFAEYRSRRPTSGLTAILSEDRPFRTTPLDAYGEAWMLAHYLLQTRPAKYSQYLQRLSQRPDEVAYSPADRLADFKGAFGDDLAWFEVEYLRFADELIARELEAPKSGKR